MSVIKKEPSAPSRVLFVNVKGEPMRFFIRPGTSKMQLRPLILNGGGVLCRSQEPNAILLADPGDITAVVGDVGHFYISTRYIYDCVAQNQQLDIDNYRFNNSHPVSTRAVTRRQQSVGRLGYSVTDDAAILNFIARRVKEVKGNRIWQQMERQHITNHSWQSMKDRFLKHLQHKLEQESSRKKATPSSSSEDHTATPKKNTPVDSSSDSDLTQISQEQGGATTVQPAHQGSSEETNGPRGPASETRQTEKLRKEVDGDESVPEAQQQQQHVTQPEVSPKRARMDTDGPLEDMLPGILGQSADPSEKQNASKQSVTLVKKLKILQRAAREFENEKLGESQEDPSLSQASVTNTFDTAESQIRAARERAFREHEVHPEHPKDTAEPAATPQHHRNIPGPEDETAGPSNAAVPVTSNAHMFLFQQESQEELSQPSEEDEPPQSLVETDQHVVRLVQESKKDLVEVMKALLKASGDVSLASSYLLEGFDPEVHGPIWTRQDDEILRSADPAAREGLHEKYGADRVSRRAAFLKADS